MPNSKLYPEPSWAGVVSEYPQETIHKIFEQNAEEFSDHIALIEDQHTLSYWQLNQKANQLARVLQNLQLPPESPVAVALPPGIDLIITLLSILKAGLAYVPLDLQYPAARIDFVLRDSQAKALITRQNMHLNLNTASLSLSPIFLDVASARIATEACTNLNLKCSNTQLAYICYTSGSTGMPKGVMVEHKGIIRLVKATNYIQITPEDRIAQVTHITFDVSAFEIWGALLNGAALVCTRTDTLLNTKLFAEFLQQQQISILWLTARLFDSIIVAGPEMFARLTYLLIGGEALNPHTVGLVAQCAQGRPRYIINGYGPTENSVFTTAYLIPPNFDSRSPIPIGRPIANTTIYVLDEQCRMVAIGEHGELYTGGDGLARGYLNRPELNRERFIRNPFSTNPENRLYRTGDIVYWRSDGNLEYVGRSDSQVKIRGFRIELGAVENVLLNDPAIAQAVVLSLPGSNYDNYLCAFLVARDDHHILDVSLVKQFLLSALPAYSVPEIFIPLEKMPLTVNGKVDREMLIKLAQQRELSVARALPQTDIEKKLMAIWSELLPTQSISLDDDFSILGGNSLLWLRLQNKIELVFKRELSFSELLSATTIAKQAQCLQNKLQFPIDPYLVLLPAGGKQPPLFLLPPVSGECLCFILLTQHLNKDQSVYGLRDPSEQQGKLLFQNLQEMAAFHVKTIRKIQPHGPYRIAGYSFGAHVAVAIATELTHAGETVEFLGLIDGWAQFPPRYLEEDFFRQRMQWLQQKLNTEKLLIDLAWQRMQLLNNAPVLKLPVKATLFKAIDEKDFSTVTDDYNHWRPIALQGIERYLVQGNHDTILEVPQVQQLAKLFQEKLTELQSVTHE
ncbi:MAG: amino acid adenylation domain-containing protein [Proteobacteria bacterium]|nr:amino acid adenylation domain-containing protein [Pseudomonadota bacterium]